MLNLLVLLVGLYIAYLFGKIAHKYEEVLVLSIFIISFSSKFLEHGKYSNEAIVVTFLYMLIRIVATM